MTTENKATLVTYSILFLILVGVVSIASHINGVKKGRIDVSSGQYYCYLWYEADLTNRWVCKKAESKQEKSQSEQTARDI